MFSWFNRSKQDGNRTAAAATTAVSSSQANSAQNGSKPINATSTAETSNKPRMKLTVSGFRSCPFFQRASAAANGLVALFSDQIELEIKVFETKEEYQSAIPSFKPALLNSSHTKQMGDQEKQRIENHKSCPMTWKDDRIFIGGCDDFLDFSKSIFGMGFPASSSSEFAWKERKLAFPKGYAPDNALPEKDHGFQYDLVVIGGGSGGLALSKQAASHGKNVALLDFVKPSPQGSEWGLGGTCVNVGCVPKKYFHQAGLLGDFISDARAYGWKGLGKADYGDDGQVLVTGAPTHRWRTLVKAVQDRAASSNFVYRVLLREKNVKYLNLLGSFVDPHTIVGVDKKGKTETITARRFVIAVGGRPKQLDCPGKELAITSDDVFSIERKPGKTLVVGGSYVALECAGYLTSLGFDVTVMVRSVLLRGFDQEMAKMIAKYMEEHGTKFIYEKVPLKLEEVPDSAPAPKEDEQEGEEDAVEYKNKIKVTWEGGEDVFDTVLCAIGRSPDTKGLGLDKAGVQVDASGKIPTINEQTNVPHIYAVGDILKDKPELTPTAITAGTLLADRLYAGSSALMDYRKVATTIFTPLEYGTVGMSEDDAVKDFGADNVEVYHTYFTPLDWNVAHEYRKTNQCYLKIIVDKSDHNRILGLHYLGPNAGEVIQGYAVAMKMGMTYEDLSKTVAIHPTNSEEFIYANITKRSGIPPMKAACCG